IADEGKGLHDDLPGVAGVGERFRVAAHVGGEHQFAQPLALRAEGIALEHRAGGKHEIALLHAAITSFSTATAVLRSSQAMLSGGKSRTLLFAVNTSTPRARQAETISPAGLSVSMPSMRPRPSTPRTPFAPASSPRM